ncbi:Lipoprotein-anchoring transpeptidase ErfK/SrfK [Mycobacterium sp. 88mf]|jgi:lipoprotein-anchoring transpeptidase ErfK/SrfK|nr:Lipoprotein-anchoring transpeptidase ErfK/SrfK [Mycobacterium sp. 88mf]SFG39182.1 Lipoprotein-anchoring transpeptidase ErfK/SrfK [Mycobacterium sp. 455mf]
MGNPSRYRQHRSATVTLRLKGAVPASTYTGGMLSAPSSSFGTVRASVLKVFAAIGVATLAAASTVNVASAAVRTPEPGATIEPAAGSVVGVAMPLTVTFDKPVADRDAAQSSLQISSPHTPTGTFSWLSDDVMQWKPDQLWPAHSKISVSAGGAKTSFETGAQVLGVADIDAHTFTVSIDGAVARTMPASMGKPKHPTPVGTFTALAKEPVVVMDSRTIGIPLSDPEGYKLTVYDAVRVTWGGVYVHGAPWSVGSQGYANVSHGCINLSPDNADWYFNTVHVGDPIVVQS